MIDIYAEGKLYMSVCTDEAPAAMVAAVQALRPAGAEHNWQIHDGPFPSGAPNPSPCSRHGDCTPKTHKHYLLSR